MGSAGHDKLISGQFMLPVIPSGIENNDPGTRGFYAPPPSSDYVPRSYPLTDVRPVVSRPDYSPEDLLKSHGFALVKHRSPFLDELDGHADEHAVNNVYAAETTELVCRAVGAKRAFALVRVMRQGQPASQDSTGPTSNKTTSDNLSGQKGLLVSKPIRMPHMDCTPLGARHIIRFDNEGIYTAARESGVIAVEDAICEKLGLSATAKGATAALAENYNQGDRLGPRYAYYSIWRPLKKVGRDPLALGPRRKEVGEAGGDMVYWTYHSKVPGAKGLSDRPDGEYLTQRAMLGVRAEEPRAGECPEELKWHYVSAQEPDEVWFVKLFDSASLGADSQHASAPWHGSPDLGDAAESDEPRESIELRVMAFW
ncbi:GA4 desaturase [Neohortaea acidophila]|uniref:GA4 desaturase n=1 Tax=Neohortaea acidophila TaxID=245834 RepID=A0A6A6PQ84_9PEZI|nr:GA4 desaturase [Neohortaea acidophila]KAF2481397.1 GA4 desaturase [Neohortaea acidophila]